MVLAMSDRDAGFGPGRYVILDLCRSSGRIEVIGTSASRNNGVYAEGEGELIRRTMASSSSALGGVDVSGDFFPLPALLEEDEDVESLGSSRSLSDHGGGCVLSADGEGDICNCSDEDAEEIDALLATTDDDDDDDDEEEEDEDSLKGCGRSKRRRIRERFQGLRRIVGADHCMDAVGVFDEAIRYLKSLQQLHVRSHESHGDAGIVPDG